MRVAVVGAGVSGLVAARGLRDAGADVTVVEKGSAPGGRVASIELAGATADHGAQFFTVRTPAFQRRVDDWLDRGVVRVWNHGFGADDGFPRYIAVDGMSALGHDLASGVDVSYSTMAFAVRAGSPSTNRRWSLVIDDGTTVDVDAVVITCPLPQAFALLADADVELNERLMRTGYDRTIALVAVLDGPPSGIPATGAIQHPNTPVSFVADNHAKGVSDVPTLTLHTTAAWSERHWDDDPGQLRRDLLDLIRPWTDGASIVDSAVKQWRFATPQTIWPDPCWVTADGRIVLAGDAFAGPRIEGAHNSGLAGVHALAG